MARARMRVVFGAVAFWLVVMAGGLEAKGVQAQNERAVQALTAGDPERALDLATQVLDQYPDDFQALYVSAVALIELGDHLGAEAFAKRAYQNAQPGPNKVQAARVVAVAQFNRRRFTRAEWWLRRAAHQASTQGETAAIAREFHAIRQRNPLSLRFGFSIAPSNNINGGTEDTEFSLGEFDFLFDPSSRSLSGIEYSGELDVSYRIAQRADRQTFVGFSLYGRSYQLSSNSRAAVQGVSGSDFALGLAEVSLAHQQVLFDGLGPSEAALHLGQVWYGGDPIWRYAKVSLAQNVALRGDARARVQLSVEDQKGLEPAQPDTVVYEVLGSYSKRLRNRDVIGIMLNARLNEAVFATNTYRDVSATLGYEFHKPILGSRVSVSAGIGARTYDEFSLSLDGRRDRYVTLGARAVFENLSYFGFSPSWSISATQTDSNVVRFSTHEVTGRLGIQSNF